MKLKYTFETMELDDDTVAVPVGEGSEQFQGVVKLNKTGAIIFDMLKEDISEEAIVEAIEEKYNASRETISADVRKYIDIFREKGLLSE